MKRRLPVCAFFAAWVVAVTAGTAGAQFPDAKTTHYKFLPRLSTITESGGFAGRIDVFRVVGEFDLKIQPSPLAVFPPVYNAFFENVDAWGIQPNRDYAVNVNEALNLEELVGGQTLHPRRPRVFHFKGRRDDGSSVDLDAFLTGPWLYLRGGTTPPAGSADMFQHHIRAVARTQPMDLNDDGVVDARDLSRWSRGFGRRTSGADFLEWQRQLGETQPTIESLEAELKAALANADPLLAAVPEPGALTLAVLGGLAIIRVRRGSACGERWRPMNRGI